MNAMRRDTDDYQRSLERLAKLARSEARYMDVVLETEAGGWLTLYDDRPHGGRWVKDAGDYFELVEVTDLDSATGASGLVMVEARVTAFDFGWRGKIPEHHKYAGVFSAFACSSIRPGFGAEMVEHARAAGRTSKRDMRHVRALIRARIAEAMVSYGHADPSDDGYQPGHVIVWQDRPARAADREEQMQSWDSWRPDGYRVEGRTRHTADYVGDAGLREAIRSFGPHVSDV